MTIASAESMAHAAACEGVPVQRRRRFTAIAIVAALTGAAACSSGSSGANSAGAKVNTALLTPSSGKTVATGAPVKVGLINDEGGSAVSFPEIRVGTEAAVKYANAYLGGIAGRPVVLDECQSKGTPASSATCANQMIADHVVAVLHGIDSDSGTTAETVMHSGIPIISTAPASAEETTGKLSFSLTGGALAFVAGLGKWMTDQHYKSSVLFAQSAPGGASLYSLATSFLKRHGIANKVILVPPGTPDITPQMASAVAGKPDFLWMLGDAGLCLAFMQAYRASGSSAHAGLIGQCTGKQVASAVSLDGAVEPAYSVPTGSNTEAQLYRAVLDAYAPGTDPNGLAYVGYTDALGVVRALRGLSGPITAKTVTAGMRAAKNIVLPVADGVTFTCDGKQVPPLPAPCSDTVFIARLNNAGIGSVLEKFRAPSLFTG
jgi:branched-chain amino acid transport system substrate-binding protein